MRCACLRVACLCGLLSLCLLSLLLLLLLVLLSTGGGTIGTDSMERLSYAPRPYFSSYGERCHF